MWSAPPQARARRSRSRLRPKPGAGAWRRSGIPVVGCALSARAACELRDQAGIDTTTIARLQKALDEGVALSAGAVLIVDEAGMAGTRDLARLAAAAERSNAKLVLVGDDRQLPEIDAGGAFRALAERLGATELREVRRQRQGWDRDALAALREGRIDRFAREYFQHGRLVAALTAEAARAALVEDWWAAHERGADALMIAHRRRDVSDLNARARERMREARRLGANELHFRGRDYAVGERVIATRNDYALGLVNREAGVVARLSRVRLRVARGAARRAARVDDRGLHLAAQQPPAAGSSTATGCRRSRSRRSIATGPSRSASRSCRPSRSTRRSPAWGRSSPSPRSAS
jgi:ATP-dependent exoDNAse (exonuclease V) alpha subunit